MNISSEDLRFLSELQHELLTQDTLCQADPRFWVVRERVYQPCWEEQADSWFLCDEEGNKIADIERNLEDYDTGELYSVPMREVYRIAPNTMFLTLRECQEHIERNHYHYTNPHPYAMTAWRSPQVERLIEILQTADFSECDGVTKQDIDRRYDDDLR